MILLIVGLSLSFIAIGVLYYLNDQLSSAFEMVKNFKEMYKQVGFPKSLSYSLDRELNKQKENLWK